MFGLKSDASYNQNSIAKIVY